jgi:hypothetical protein
MKHGRAAFDAETMANQSQEEQVAMDYKKVKEEIKVITEIASGVPEPFRARCFEVLLEHLLAGQTIGEQEKKAANREPSDVATVAGKKVPIPSQVRVLMMKTGVSEEDLNGLLMYADGEVHFIKEPSPSSISRGQREWALFLALRNGILTNSLSADPEDVRSICQEKGFYDRANFASNFKVASFAKLFKKPLEPHGEGQELSAEGQAQLAKLVKTLVGISE